MNSPKLAVIQNVRPHALQLSKEQWQQWCEEQQLPAYVAVQIIGWIYQKNSVNPIEFSSLKLDLRQKLQQQVDWSLPSIGSHLVSEDKSQKFLLKTHDNHLFEMVLMPYEERVTLCVSSQVGCKMGCTFCQTGKMGFTRNLSAGEILSQIILANRFVKGAKISNIVFMGMGEPLDNYDEVVAACRMMIDKQALALPPYRVTISTSGLVPEIQRLGQDLPVRLAISLHSADEQKRSEMMPINRRYPLAVLKEVLLTYPAPKKFGITFEYVMIMGKNDSLADAKKLVHFLHGMKAKVNLIPINHFPGIEMSASDAASLRAFQRYLSERSIPAPIRYSRGQDISGGCGQLAAKAKEQLHLDPRVLHRERRKLIRQG